MMDRFGRGVTIPLGLTVEKSSTPCFLERFLELGVPGSLTEESNSDSKTPLKVCSIKAGGMMSFAIDSLGTLWMWGNCPPQGDSSDGEFTFSSSSTPIPIWDFHGHTVVKVACGNEHIVALVSTGETFTGGDLVCYSWGKNNHGQLGLGDRESRTRPQVVETFNEACPWAVYEIACGAFHTVALSIRKVDRDIADASGERECTCWTFGLGENGQLGHGTTNTTSLPQPVDGLPQDAILVSVDCGLFNTCVASADGDVWAWGMEKGLGLCPEASFSGIDAGDALYPSLIPCGEFHGSKFVDPMQVACGAAHTVLVTDNGYKLWAWGRGRSGVLGRGNMMDSFIPCIAMWPPLHKDFEEEKGIEQVDGEEKIEENEFGKVTDMKKRLSSVMEDMQLLQSKLALMERYAGILHACIFGKPFEERDLPSSLRTWGMFTLDKEWESMLESADRGKLIQMQAFYRNMLAGVKDKLMKRRIEELIKECTRS
ncbi:ultraviolet-B receptor UVR8 isoform X2 [Magnolia sinica]|uniref:ultraviolet-B receptor UVR8 isoform X2 n=1 Tax=Magnolia sinica TaxID=86752 RepID=UPI00265A2454|nr:ultraviolet-B receptor UVR8 isoform X2 [Magnolia sinica]